MKRVGLIGGTTWHSTADYYSRLNRLVQERLGGLSSAECLIASVDFAPIDKNNKANDQPANERIMLDAAKRLKAAGAQGIAFCANTPHMFAENIKAQIKLPLIHIGDATTKEVVSAGISTIALLGTRYTMEKDFFYRRLADAGIIVLIPEDSDRQLIHDSIFDEFAKGIFSEQTRSQYVRVIDDLTSRGAQGVILGCTEMPLLIRPEDVFIPTFDTTAIHVRAIGEFMLG